MHFMLAAQCYQATGYLLFRFKVKKALLKIFKANIRYD